MLLLLLPWKGNGEQPYDYAKNLGLFPKCEESLRSEDNAMPFVPVPLVVQAELIYTWDGQIVENVLHYEPSVPPTPALMEQLGAALVTWFNADVGPYVSNTVSLIEVKLTDLTTAFAPVVNFSTGLPITGDRVSASLPNSVALVMTKRTGLRGRSFRGRVYQVGLCEDQVTANAVIGTSLAGLITSWNNNIEITTAGATWEMVVVSRWENNIERSEGLATEVTNFTTDGRIDSMRRRLPGRGS